MSLVDPRTTVVPAVLVRPAEPTAVYPGLERVGARLERGIAALFSDLLSASVRVSRSPVRIEGPKELDPDVTRSFRLRPLNGSAVISVERDAIPQLVDMYYGGCGAPRVQQGEMSPAGKRLFDRIAVGFATILPAAWQICGVLTAETDSELGTLDGQVALQPFTVRWPDGPELVVECLYPLAMIETVPGLRSSAPGEDCAPGEDIDWQARLMSSVLEVRFPVRAIFAEPELPLSAVLALKAGDLIPVTVPSLLDLVVAGRIFARGRAGEANGRAAIAVEHL